MSRHKNIVGWGLTHFISVLVFLVEAKSLEKISRRDKVFAI